VGPGPLLGCCYSCRFILLPSLRDIRREWIVWVWCTKEGLNREEDSTNLQGGRPITLEHVKTDSTKLVDIGVVNLGEEANLRWSHRVVIWEKQLELENPAFVWRLAGSLYRDIEIPKIILVRDCADTRHWLCHQPFRLLDNPLRKRHFDVYTRSVRGVSGLREL